MTRQHRGKTMPRLRPFAGAAFAVTTTTILSTSSSNVVLATSASSWSSPPTIAVPYPASKVNRGNTLNVILGQIKEREKKHHILRRKIEKEIPEQWFPQVFDHFGGKKHVAEQKNGADGKASEEKKKTWPQRFFENDEHFKAGGPVFLMIGGEGEISADYVGDRFLAAYLGKQFGGAVLALEHRFYGQSQPHGGDLSDLSLLSSQQALADLAGFVTAKKKGKYSKSKFLCLGGSYPGNLAAWFRQKYPDVVDGCFSFSAPIFAKKDFYEYGQMVFKALGSVVGGNTEVSAKLLSGYESILTDLNAGTPAARKSVLQNLNACPFTVLSQADEANVESMLTGVSAGVVQYNNTLPSGRKIEDVAKIVGEAATPEDAAWAIFSKFAEGEAAALTGLKPRGKHVDKGNQQHDDNNKGNKNQSTAIAVTPIEVDCIDYSQREEYSSLVPDAAAAARSWVYQTCNEFGYFQTSRVSLEKKSLYTPGVSDPSLWDGICENVFGISNVEARVANTRTYYDIDESEVSKTIFINGELDPWSTLSRGPSPISHIVPHGSHCVGLYGNPEDPLVMPAAKELQRELIKVAGKWLAEQADGTSLAAGDELYS
ncbi:unnamed protein product [Amoebophrya sp. A25]|nr:unnamed protein product [Amoebophrya sp. A25]|eukprot:GSA25T00003368001.1